LRGSDERRARRHAQVRTEHPLEQRTPSCAVRRDRRNGSVMRVPRSLLLCIMINALLADDGEGVVAGRAGCRATQPSALSPHTSPLTPQLKCGAPRPSAPPAVCA
jgi:hypothetical protein